MLAPKLATMSMSQNSASQSQERRKFVKLRYVAVVVVLLWGGYHYFHVQRAQYVQLQHQRQQLAEQLQVEQNKQVDLNREVKEFNSDDFIARYASQHLNLIEPGQVPFVVNH